MKIAKGDVLILSGISGAGKSTLGEALRDYLIEKGQKTTVLDGDCLRTKFEEELKYSPEDRLMVSKILAYAAHLLSENGVHVILATMLSQPGAREFMSRRVEFCEIFLDACIEECKKKDVKTVYQENLSNKEPNIVGHDLVFSRAETPDLVIETLTETPEQSLKKIIKFLSGKNLFNLGHGTCE
jgi:adenylylsulfate kinase-like enzyme